MEIALQEAAELDPVQVYWKEFFDDRRRQALGKSPYTISSHK